MPFDFRNYKTYNIDYPALFDEINAKKIFSNRELQIQYISKWLQVLIHYDEILLKQFYDQNSIKEYILKMQNEPEIFQLPINWDSTNIMLHFRVSIANELLKDFHSQSEELFLEDFIGEKQTVYWSEVEDNVEKYFAANEPVIIVPFLSGKTSLLVIDGNHRITYKKRHNITIIPSLIMTEHLVIETKIFSSSFDEYYYIFHNEVNRIENELRNGTTSEAELINKSFLMGRGYRFFD